SEACSPGRRAARAGGRPYGGVQPWRLRRIGHRQPRGSVHRRGRCRDTPAAAGRAVTLFVDTSFWYAAADAGDRSNQRCRRVLSAGEGLLTTDHVLVETWILLRHRLGRTPAECFWQGLRGGVAIIEPVVAGDLEVAFAIGEAFSDQDFSIVDRTSF